MSNKIQEAIITDCGHLCYAIASSTSKENRCHLLRIRSNNVYFNDDYWGNISEFNPQNESHIKAKEFFFTRAKHIIEEKELELGVLKAKLLEISKNISLPIVVDINESSNNFNIKTIASADEPVPEAGEQE